MSKTLTIKIAMGNAAFQQGCDVIEVSRILKKYIDKIHDCSRVCDMPMMDINGNKVGEAEVEVNND